MKIIPLALCILISANQNAFSQVRHLKEMSTEQIRTLNKEKTIVLMPGGILEEHGPHLPSYTDGFVNEYLAREIAREFVAKRNDWTVVLFPSIPLGAGGGNHIGLHNTFDGTYHVHFSTLRAVYMDVAYELGRGGFKWIFVFQKHGSYWHNLAIDQAAEFFNDSFKGKMVNVTGIIIDEMPNDQLLGAKHALENGFDVHGGFSETSRILFLHPDLVDKNYQQLRSITGKTWKDLIAAGSKGDWPGYFGAPRFASADAGDKIMNRFVDGYKKIVFDVIDEKDISTLRTIVKERSTDPDALYYNNKANEHNEEAVKLQESWLERKGY